MGLFYSSALVAARLNGNCNTNASSCCDSGLLSHFIGDNLKASSNDAT